MADEDLLDLEPEWARLDVEGEPGARCDNGLGRGSTGTDEYLDLPDLEDMAMGPDHDEAEDGDVESCRDGSATEAAGAFKVKRWSRGPGRDPGAGRPLEAVDRTALDHLISEAIHQADVSVGVALPWETGVLGDIFDAPKAMLDPLHFEACEVPATVEVGAPSAKRPRLRTGLKGPLHTGAINRKLTLSDADSDARRQSQATEVWYTIEALGLERCFISGQGPASAEQTRERILDLCGGRSPATILKRGRAVLRYVRWCRQRMVMSYAFPACAWKTEAYMGHLAELGARPSAFNGFVEGLNFAVHVVGLEGKEGYLSRLALGRLARAQLEREPKRQARPLLVKEVAALEEILRDESVDEVDRYAAGVFLFNVYSRSRWSDIRAVGGFVADLDRAAGCSGYLEFSTRSHKTSRLVARQGLVMPLVSPAWGITSSPWGLDFISVARQVGLELGRPGRAGAAPLLPAPIDSGWSRRSVTSTEATTWLRALLDSREEGEHRDVSSHSLKATLLSWCAKVGVDKDVRSILGHHSTGKHSAETYSRDLLSAPLRELDEVIRKVRVGSFLPDLTRSGQVKVLSQVVDPKDAFDSASGLSSGVPEPDALGEATKSPGSSSSSSSDSSSSDPSEIGQVEEDLGPAGEPQLSARPWEPGYEMFQHRRTQVVHLRAEGSVRAVAQCGLKLTGDYALVDGSRFLDLRKCKRCEGARPLRDVGALAAALEARHKGGR